MQLIKNNNQQLFYFTTCSGSTGKYFFDSLLSQAGHFKVSLLCFYLRQSIWKFFWLTFYFGCFGKYLFDSLL